MLTRLRRALEKPSRITRAIKRRLPNVIATGSRATCKRVNFDGTALFKKEYHVGSDDNGEIAAFLKREKSARQIFEHAPWMLPIRDEGEDWIAMPMLPDENRLDRCASGMDPATRTNVATMAVSALLDMHTAGYCHGDIHAGNLYWFNEQLIITDFEKMTAYPDGARPAFKDAFDLTGDKRGMVIPGNADAITMFWDAGIENISLDAVLKISAREALEALEARLTEELRDACAGFQSHTYRHEARARMVYSAFDLPCFTVQHDAAQRNCARRLEQFGIGHEQLSGRSVLDLGCNIGGMLFEAQKFAPGRCRGVEYDPEKVAIANRIAGYNGLSNLEFIAGNVDELAASDLEAPFDVVFCLSLIDHVSDPAHLYALLGSVTGQTLYFEGNAQTDRSATIDELQRAGFADVNFLGTCDDDCRPENNVRPLFRVQA